jgi:hypothetical protein
MNCHKQRNMVSHCEPASNVKAKSGNQDQDIQKCAFCWESDVDTVLQL